jgi:ABC-type multidrug transport system ATPase subunit
LVSTHLIAEFEGLIDEFTVMERGKEVLEGKGVEVDHQGRGGIVHRYWQHRIQEVFRLAGWDPELEHVNADVYVSLDGQDLAVEVAMGDNDREVDHAKERLEHGVDEVWVVCQNKSVIAELKQAMEEKDLPMECIEFKRFRDFKDADIFESSELAI